MAVRVAQNMTPSGTTHYVYDRAGRLLAESTGTAQREYVWIDDMPLALVADIDTASPQLWYVHPDHLDRPARMTDPSQAVVWDAWYWPYGEVRSITGSASNNLRFPGQYFLVESGLHYNWHRHYDPTLGRYVQPDPLREASGAKSLSLDVPAIATISQIDTQLGLTQGAGSSIDDNTQISSELPEFVDGPSVCNYARSMPTMRADKTGLTATGPYSSAAPQKSGQQYCMARPSR